MPSGSGSWAPSKRGHRSHLAPPRPLRCKSGQASSSPLHRALNSSLFSSASFRKTPQGTAFPPSLPRSIQAFSHLSCTVFPAMLILPIFSPCKLTLEVLFSLTAACGSVPTDSLERCAPETLESAWVTHLHPLTKEGSQGKQLQLHLLE